MLTHDVADYLVSSLSIPTADVYEGHMPDRSGTAVAVYQFGGFWPLLATVPNPVEKPQCHIIVRADTYDAAMAMADTIFQGLHMLSEVTINTRRYLYFRALGSPNLMRADYAQNPPQYYVNVDFEVYKEVD